MAEEPQQEQRIGFDPWWRLVMRVWRFHGYTASVPEPKLLALYGEGLSPLEAGETLAREAAEKAQKGTPTGGK